MTSSLNSTIKFYKNNNIELSGNFIELSSNFVNNNSNKIFLVLKKDNTNYISITRKNINNNISKKDKKIFFNRSNTNNNIVSGFNNISPYTNPINLQQNNYLFNSNDISNNSTAILNYKLFPLTRGNTRISQIDLSNSINGLLTNLTDFSRVDNINFYKNNYFTVDKYIPQSNKIQNINYIRPSSISFELIQFNDLERHYNYDISVINNIQKEKIDISSTNSVSIAYSPFYNIYVGIINYYIPLDTPKSYYYIIDNNNLDSSSISVTQFNEFDIGNSIIWSEHTKQFIVKGKKNNVEQQNTNTIIILTSLYIDIADKKITWIESISLNGNSSMDIVLFSTGASWNQLYIDTCNNYLILTGEIFANGGWYNFGKISDNKITFKDTQGHRWPNISYFSNIIYISTIDEYFALGINRSNKGAYGHGPLSTDSYDISFNDFTPIDYVNNRVYDCIFSETHSKIYGLADYYQNINRAARGILLVWNVNPLTKTIAFDSSYIFQDTNSQFRIKAVTDRFLLTCGRTSRDGVMGNGHTGHNSSYNKIYLDSSGRIHDDIIGISFDLHNNYGSLFHDFDFNNNILEKSVLFVGNYRIHQYEHSNALITKCNLNKSIDGSKNTLNLTYTFIDRPENSGADPSYYIINNPRDLKLNSAPVNIDLYQLTKKNTSLNYDFKTREYLIFSDNFKLIPSSFINITPFNGNLNQYLYNNIYRLFYNNKVISFENINMHYDAYSDELIIQSLNRYFIGQVNGDFKLKYFNDHYIDYNFKSNEFKIIINVICNPNLCPLPALPDRRQMTNRIGSMASFRMQFSNNIQNVRRGSRRTTFIDQRKPRFINTVINNNPIINPQVPPVLPRDFPEINGNHWTFDYIKLILQNHYIGFINEYLGDLSINIPDPFIGENRSINNNNSMQQLFQYANSGINPNIGHWDVSSIINMSYMFNGATSFTGISLELWDVSNVINMSYMFADSSFNTDISNWNIVNVFTSKQPSNYINMFLNCLSLSSSIRNSIREGWTNTLKNDISMSQSDISNAFIAANLIPTP